MRQQFLLDPDIHFLNHGSFGACPAEVFDIYQGWQREMERNPVAFLSRQSGELLLQARQTLATYLGASADDLTWMPNATTAVNTVARSMQLQPGDEVLATDHEYGACDAAWQFVCERAGAVYLRVALPLPFVANEVVPRLMAAVGPRTKLIFASHITSTTALILPVTELCAAARALGVLTLIDGAHAPGHIALDLTEVDADFYTGNCHKWLCAPKGAAFLHVRPEHQEGLHASVVSWGYVAGASSGPAGFDAYTGNTLMERRLQWQGTRDLAAFLSVPAAIDFQRRQDWPAVRQRCHALACFTRARVLSGTGLQLPASDVAHGQMVIIPVELPAGMTAENLRQHLFDHHHIEVPVTQHAGHSFVRLSVQAYNDEADVDALVSTLISLASGDAPSSRRPAIRP